ncbi:MAG: hypothetical protein LBS51_00210 [Oscillospiraceae bacterium]|nr:hypothetical protein [Oscillospiraceae bacterium]
MKKITVILLMILISAAFGFVIGYFGVTLFENLVERQTANEVLLYAVLLICLVLSFMLHIPLHEAGHLLSGKLSGYDFVSFRVLNIMFIKQNGKIARKKFKIVGTLGQCLMSPPEPVDGRYPFVLYNLGGSLMNLTASAAGLGFYLLFSKALPMAAAICAVFAIVGILMSLINLIPMKPGGVANDGYNALTLVKRESARRAFWLLLRINTLTQQGARFRDMPAEWFDIPDDGLNDTITTVIALYRFSYLLDKHDFAEAKILAELLLNGADKMLEIHKTELRCELLFLEIIGECRVEEIERIYDKKLKNYIKATGVYVSHQRLLYAYEKLVVNDEGNAQKVLDRFQKACLTYPNVGEIESERDLIEVIDNIALKKRRQLNKC